MMKILLQKRMYLPAITIIAVVLLLLLLIGISTYRNLDHEEKTALKFTHRQGLTILHALEAGARTGMMMPMWGKDSIGSLIQETGKSEDIAYVYLIDSQGTVVHHSTPSLEGMHSDWLPQLDNSDNVQTRIKRSPDGIPIYDLAKRFSPLPFLDTPSSHDGTKGLYKTILSHQHSDSTIVLGLNMTAFEEARLADIHHAIIMAAIVVALGSGVIFFIFVIQNYYLVDKTLKQTQDYTRQVVANMANGLLSIDIKGKIIAYNQLALELLGLQESELQEINLKNLIDFETTGIQYTLTQCESVLDREIEYQKDSGAIVPIALSVTPILEKMDICIGAVIVIRDLSEIKQLEEKVRRSEKLAAIGKLSAGVAHEIRNPLSSIRGFAKYLYQTLADRPKEREYTEIMVNEVDRINSVVNDLLTFARPMELEPTPTDMMELINHAVRLVQADAKSRDISIRKNTSPDLRKISLDNRQMTQVLINLLLNSLQEVADGGKIEVGAELDATSTRLYLWVEDDGPGIPANTRQKIFDPFFTTREKGTGLGLAIVHKIVENHNGEIRVESPLPGKSQGCRFTIIIPANDTGSIKKI
jgi:two-component system sensor histidine kinase HydH